MGGKIIKLDFSKLNLIPRQGGYMIVEQAIIAAFYTQLHSHSVDLYAFRLIPKDGSEVVKLMNGSLVAPYAHIKGKEAVDKYSEEHSPELLDAITQFSKNNYRATRRNNKTILQAEDGQNIALISAPCDKGIIVGGWHNSQGDTDVSKQMLAFVLYCFAALNSAGNNPDVMLLERVYHTLPRDSRYGKFDAEAAKEALLETLAELHQNRTTTGNGTTYKNTRRFPRYS